MNVQLHIVTFLYISFVITSERFFVTVYHFNRDCSQNIICVFGSYRYLLQSIYAVEHGYEEHAYKDNTAIRTSLNFPNFFPIDLM